MRSSIKITALLLLSGIILTGCSATPEECDPSVSRSVWNKVACNVSGSYDTRVEQKELELSKESSINAGLNDILQQIQQQQSAVKQTKAQKQAQLSKLNSSVSRLTQQLKQKAGSNQSVQRQINEVQAQMKKVSQAGSNSAEQAELQKLRAKVAALQQAIAY